MNHSAILTPAAFRSANRSPAGRGAMAVRYGPRIVVFALGALALAASWRVAGRETASAAPPVAGQAGAEPSDLQRVSVELLPGDTLLDAVGRLGLSNEAATAAAQALATGLQAGDLKPGQVISATVEQPGEGGEARLASLSLRTSPDKLLALARGYDGQLSLERFDEQTQGEPVEVEGSLNGSLYESALRAGATPEVTEQAGRLFARRVDFQRDLDADDRFRLVFERRIGPGGHAYDDGELLYAELGAGEASRRFYRFQPLSSPEPQFYDADGRSARGLLLRTPLAAARVTSSFGMRMHPIYGYTRMHEGIDFGAPIGTPVFAAGDGVVEQAQWSSGYGRWIEIRHSGEWSTGYGHLSAWAVKPGQSVRQGQVVGYVGQSGVATGPHLHYEVIHFGTKIDPASARAPQGSELSGRDLAAFMQQKARIDGLLTARRPPLPGAQVASLGLRGGLRGALR